MQRGIRVITLQGAIEKSPIDDPERNDLKSRLWLFFSPFLFHPKKRGEKKRRMNSKNRDFKSCLSKSSVQYCYHNIGNLNDWMTPSLFRILVVAILFSPTVILYLYPHHMTPLTPASNLDKLFLTLRTFSLF